LFILLMAGPKCSWKLCIICIKKDIYKTYTLKVLPFCTYTLVPVVLPLLEAPLGVLFGMAVRFTVVFCWLPSTEAKQWPFSPALITRKSQKLHGERSIKYVGWGMVGIWFFQNCHTVWEVW
jgi:hypothetical protein